MHDANRLVIVDRPQPGVRLLTLNRPKQHNALSKALLLALERAIDDANADPELRCIVITGAGSSFSAGADIIEEKELSPEAAYAHMRWGQALCARIECSAIPIIAALNGLSLGGGLELALACDLRLAADGAEFALPEAAMATVPAWGGLPRLVRLVGASNAKMIAFSARRHSAEQACTLGFVNAVHAGGELLDQSLSLAQEIATHPAEVVRTMKSLIAQVQTNDDDAGFEAQARAAQRLWSSPARRIAIERFASRPRPSRAGVPDQG
jgi:enoyl-CoA hydratase/carnithine racemase